MEPAEYLKSEEGSVTVETVQQRRVLAALVRKCQPYQGYPGFDSKL